jgi:hypothetical protein
MREGLGRLKVLKSFLKRCEPGVRFRAGRNRFALEGPDRPIRIRQSRVREFLSLFNRHSVLELLLESLGRSLESSNPGKSGGELRRGAVLLWSERRLMECALESFRRFWKAGGEVRPGPEAGSEDEKGGAEPGEGGRAKDSGAEVAKEEGSEERGDDGEDEIDDLEFAEARDGVLGVAGWKVRMCRWGWRVSWERRVVEGPWDYESVKLQSSCMKKI